MTEAKRERTKALTVHRTRRKARKEERRIQNELLARGVVGGQVYDGDGSLIPEWVNGARVEKIGLFQYAVIATERRGH